MIPIILRVLSALIMLVTFSVIVDSQLELKPDIVSLILRQIFIKRMEALGHGMFRLGIVQKGLVEATERFSTAIGYACESVKEGDMIRVDSFGGYWKVKKNE